MRVETLEETAADDETRISAAEDNIEGKSFPNKGIPTLIISGSVSISGRFYPIGLHCDTWK